MTRATDINGDTREWLVKCTYPTGETDYGMAMTKKAADAWVKINTRFYGDVLKYESVHVSEVKQNSPLSK